MYLQRRNSTRPVNGSSELDTQIKGEKEGHTAVVPGNQADNCGPDERKHERHPAFVEGVDATGNRVEHESILLDDVVRDHGDGWHNQAEEYFEGKAPPGLLATRDQNDTVRVQEMGEGTEDTHQGSWYAHIAGYHQLNFDIAEANAAPPRIDIICRPDSGVHDVENVVDKEPDDKA